MEITGRMFRRAQTMPSSLDGSPKRPKERSTPTPTNLGLRDPMTPQFSGLRATDDSDDSSDDDSDFMESMRQSVEELPDLTDRIKDLGVYDEYRRYREGYMQWRKGSGQGAAGELNAGELRKRLGQRFFEWYPNYQVWHWRRSISYWVAVTFFEGCIFFTLSSFFAAYKADLGYRARPLTAWGMFVGGVFFLICTYLMCVQTINLGKGKFYWWPFAWRTSLARLAEMNVSAHPYVVSVVYFLGAVVYTLPTTVELMELELPHWGNMVVFTIPYVIGGGLFAAGGLVECFECKVFTSKPTTHEWWGAFLNLTGGVMFFVAGIVEPWTIYWCDMLFGMGSALYLIGATVMIAMWKDEQFGLTFLSALNKLEKLQHGSDEDDESEQPFFSLRGLIFLILYQLTASMAVYNFLLIINAMELEHFHWYLLSDAYYEALTFFLLHLYLAMLSAVVRTPKMEPYHSLFIGVRLLSIPLALNSFMIFFEGVIRGVFLF